MARAVETVIDRAEPGARGPLRNALALVFTKAPAVRADMGAGAGLKAAVAAQVDLLRAMVDDSGRPFYDTVPVDPDDLADELAEAFLAALEHAVVSAGPREQVDALRAERLLGEVEAVPGRVAERLSGSLDEIVALLRGLGEPTAAVGGEAFDAVRERYLQRVRERYRRVDLEILTPLTEQGEHPAMPLGQVFVPQRVRNDPPPVDLPREVWRRLAAEGHLESVELPPEVDRERLAEIYRAYRQRPARPVLDVAADPAARTMVVLGDPGAGKSTLARYLMLALAEAPAPNGDGAGRRGWRVPEELRGRLPLLVELRVFADARWRGATFLDLIDELDRTEGLGIPKPLLDGYLSGGGRALVIFDGLDEIFDPRVRAEVTRQIEGFAARYPAARVMVTSRVIGYSRSVLDAANFKHFMLQDLDFGQIREFTAAWYGQSCAGDAPQARRLQGRLLGAVKNSAAVAELAGNPMLLTILAIIGRRRKLPRDRRRVYRHAVEVLIEHWDVNKHLADERVPLLEHDEKLRLLHLVARQMQDGPAGLAGNHLPAKDLLERFRSYLDEEFALPKERAVPAARAMLRQFQERNFILSSFGAGVYGFVHRAFLEYLAAHDILHRFNTRDLSEDDLLDVFQRHWQDPAWAEVLVLLAGMVPERFAAAAITGLLEADARWRVKSQPPWHLLLAFRALGEIRRTTALAPHAGTVTSHLCDLLTTTARREDRFPSDRLIDRVEPVLTQLLDGSELRWLDRERYNSWYRARRLYLPSSANRTTQITARIHLAGHVPTYEQLHQAMNAPDGTLRRVAVQMLAENWSDDPGTLRLLRDRVVNDPDRAVREMAVRMLADGWGDDPGILRLLRDRVVDDPDDVVRRAALRTLADGWGDDPGTLRLLRDRAANDPDAAVREVAVQTVVEGWTDDPEVPALLRDRAANDPDKDVREVAVQLVAEGWGDDPGTLPLLRDRAANDPHWAVRHGAVLMIAEGWGDDPGTLPLLRDRVVNDPDEVVRQVAVQTVAEGWGDDPGTLPLLRDRVVNDPDKDVRRVAVQLMAEGWGYDPGALARLRDRAADDTDRAARRDRVVNDPDEVVRRATEQMVAEGWRYDPEALTWLRDRASHPDRAARRDRAVNDPDEVRGSDADGG